MPEIGDTLREARMRQQIDITEVEAATKIRAKYLRALENEEWGLLPEQAYIKSFIQVYAKYLGLDAKVLLDTYRLRFEQYGDPELKNIRRRQRELERRNSKPKLQLGTGALVGLLLAGLATVLLILGLTGGNDSSVQPNLAPNSGQASKITRLSLAAEGPVWVCLKSASGKRLINGRRLKADSKRRRYSSSYFDLTLSNGKVKLLLNGQRVAVPKNVKPIIYRIKNGRAKRKAVEGGPDYKLRCR